MQDAETSRARRRSSKGDGNKPRAASRPSDAPRERPDNSRRLKPGVWSAVLICFALAAAIAAVYAPVLRFDFVSWDDPWYVSKNPHVLGGLSWPGVVWAFTTGGDFYWHPLTWLSHQLDVTLFGVNAGWHHVTNVLLHVVNALLLFSLLTWSGSLSALTEPKLDSVIQERPPDHVKGAIAAALFALHPLRVESVAWIAERKDVLGGLFWMLAVAAYFFYARNPGWRRYLLVAAAFAAGLMAKPMIVTLPVVLLLLDIWPLGRWKPAGDLRPFDLAQGRPERVEGRPAAAFGTVARDTTESRKSTAERRTWLFIEKLPLFALSLLVTFATVLVQARAGAVGGLSQLSLDYRVSNALVSYLAYLGTMVWPVNLAAFYPYPPGLPSWWLVGLAAVAVVGGLVAAVKLARTRPYVTTGVLWYLVTLLPVSGVFQAGDQLRADRFTYLPSIGIILVVVWGGADLVDGLRRRLAPRQRWIPRTVAATIAAVAVLACASAARAQVFYWRNSETLWTRALAVTEGNHRAHAGLAEWKAEHGELAPAEAHYREAVRLAPAGADYRHGFAMVLLREGKTDEAANQLEAAVRSNPRHAPALTSLGAIRARQGRNPEAIRLYQEALRVQPDMPQALSGLGFALVQAGRFEEAARACTQAVQLDRASFDGRMCAGLALARLGQPNPAAAEFREATLLDPSSEAAFVNLGIALTQVKVDRRAEAIAAFEQALRINPGNAPVRSALEGLRKLP